METVKLKPLPTAQQAEEDRTARQLRILQELTEMGMSLVRKLQTQASGHPDPAVLAKSFVGIADEVRRTIALEARIAEDHRRRTAPPPAPAPRASPGAGRRAGFATTARLELQRRFAERVRTAVRAAIAADSEPDQVAARNAKLDECLGNPRIRLELTRRPLAEIAGTICRALRVSVDPSLFADLTRPRRAIAAPAAQPAAEGPAPLEKVSSLPPPTRTVH